MGSCIGIDEEDSKSKTTFENKFSHNTFKKSSTTEQDMIEALVLCDWTDKNNIIELKHLLRLYEDKV